MLEIRQITAVNACVSAAFGRLIPQLSPTVGIPSPADLERIVASPNTALFAAFAADQIAGVLSLAWYDVPSGRKAWIEDVVVDSAFRGSGAGGALVRAALAHAEQIGAGKVQLTSSPAREAARALYRREGFQEVETSVFVFKTNIK